MGGHDVGRYSPRIVRPDHCRRIASLVLGRRARQESDALLGWPARWQLVDCICERPWPGQIRWRRAGAKFRKSKPREHALEQTVQSLFKNRHGGSALPGIRTVVGWTR